MHLHPFPLARPSEGHALSQHPKQRPRLSFHRISVDTVVLEPHDWTRGSRLSASAHAGRLFVSPALCLPFVFSTSRFSPQCRLAFGLGLIFTCLVAVRPGASYAQSTGDLSSFPFLQIEPSARAAAMGGAFGAVADGDVNGLFYNPALLDTASHRHASVSYLNHFAGANVGAAVYAHHVTPIATTVGVGVRFLSWDELEGRDAFGNRTGGFGAGDAALTLGAARAYGQRWQYGVNVHVIYSAIETSRATALTADVGLRYDVSEQLLTLGASVHHAGVTLDGFAGGREELPFDVRLSASKALAHAPFRFSLTVYDLSNWRDGVVGGTSFDHVLGHLIFGTELSLGDILRVRLGYNHRRSTELAVADRLDLAGLGLGFGIHVSRLHVDYAYNSWSTTGGLHQFTLRSRI